MQVYIKPQLEWKLREYSKKTGRAMSQLIAEGLTQIIGEKPKPEYNEQPDVFVSKPPDPELGYPCCSKQKPCKHWHWNDVDSVWVNELTNKTREVL